MPKQNFDVITIGGSTRDIMFYIDQGKIVDNIKGFDSKKFLAFELAAKINIKKPYFTTGGGACNTAINFSNLGLKAATIIRVGNDKEGVEAIKELKSHKINTDLIEIDKRLATGFSFLVIGGKDKEYVAFLYRGANDNLEIINSNLELKNKWLYVSSLSGENWENTLDKIKKLKGNNKLAWNPGKVQLEAGYSRLKKFLEITDILILNRAEALELLSSAGEKTDGPEFLLKKIQSWGPKIVTITEGDEGAWVYDGKKNYYQKAYEVDVVDTTGAGDAFGSTFVAGIILGNDLEKSLKMALINSAESLTEIGAHLGLLNLKELKEKYLKFYEK